MPSPFFDNARTYWSRNLVVIPIQPNSKKPATDLKGWQGHLGGSANAATQEEWLSKYHSHGIGVLLGSPIAEDDRLAAVDIDDDRYVAVARVIIGSPVISKVGRKGTTIFVRASPDLKNSQKKTPDGKIGFDFLAAGRMTVLPPSIHPDSGKPYSWQSEPLYSADLITLPIFDRHQYQILATVVSSPHTLVLMTGEGTHDAGPGLTAALVIAGASDQQINVIVRALLPTTYSGNTLEELPGWISSARDKGFDRVQRLPIDEQVARIIQQELAPLVYVAGDGFLKYADGCWSTVSDTDIDRRSKSLLIEIRDSKAAVRPMLENVRKVLALNVQMEEFGKASGRICVRNGTINLLTGELEAHIADHQLRYKLDIDFDEAAQCPVYVGLIESVLKGDPAAIATFDEFAGLTLIPEMRFQKALYLVGAAGSGKSTLLRCIEMLHDPHAVATTSLSKLEEERYVTDVARKLVCISYDTQTRRSIFGETFIRITGCDSITTRRLYSEVEGRVSPTVRFIGSMNTDVPPSRAAADALQRRLIFLTCGEKQAKPNPELATLLHAERAGILARWVLAVRRLVARGGFEPPPDSAEAVAEYLQDRDPFESYIEEHLDPTGVDPIPVVNIARAYNNWAKDFRAFPLSIGTVGRKLAALGFKRGSWRGPDGQGPNQRTIFARIRIPFPV